MISITKYCIELNNQMVDYQYKHFVELLMQISNLEMWEIEDRKDKWEEYEVWAKHIYCVEIELSDKEYTELSKHLHINKIQ